MAVRWGRKPVCLKDIPVLGVDEIAWHKGHQYLTLVYQLDAGCRRLLWVGQHRKMNTLEDCFDWFGQDRSASWQVVCSDLRKPYLTVVSDRASQAVRVLDRFLIMKKLSEAIDKIRAAKARQLTAQGKEPVLKNSRWLLLKWREHLSELQVPRRQELLKLNLDTVGAYLLEEEFRQLINARSPTRTNRFLKRWRRRAYRTKLQPWPSLPACSPTTGPSSSTGSAPGVATLPASSRASTSNPHSLSAAPSTVAPTTPASSPYTILSLTIPSPPMPKKLRMSQIINQLKQQ